jgi:hypothetical protein
MEGNRFNVEEIDMDDLTSIKEQYQVPAAFQSCHTAIVDGYVIEGHVPAADVARLLSDRPDVLGLAVAGMPVGSPGMDSASGVVEPFDVVTFTESGVTEVYASYPQD